MSLFFYYKYIKIMKRYRCGLYNIQKILIFFCDLKYKHYFCSATIKHRINFKINQMLEKIIVEVVKIIIKKL